MSKEHLDCDCGCGDRAWIPLNSRIQVVKDNSIDIIPPKGWSYVGFKKGTTQLLRTAAGGTTVSCTCNTTGTCLPFVISGKDGSSAGCAGTCTNCTMKQGAIIGGKHVVFENGGYIDLSDTQTNFVKIGLQIPAAFSAMFELPEVKKALKDFIDRVYGGLPYPKITIGENYISAPDGYSFAAVSIFGRATMVPVPTVALEEAGGSVASCSCTNGTCSIKTHSVPFLGSATYCEGACTGTCTLSGAISIGNGNVTEIYNSIAYRY